MTEIPPAPGEAGKEWGLAIAFAAEMSKSLENRGAAVGERREGLRW
jgi:hypothetical protein